MHFVVCASGILFYHVTFFFFSFIVEYCSAQSSLYVSDEILLEKGNTSSRRSLCCICVNTHNQLMFTADRGRCAIHITVSRLKPKCCHNRQALCHTLERVYWFMREHSGSVSQQGSLRAPEFSLAHEICVYDDVYDHGGKVVHIRIERRNWSSPK